MERIVPDDIAHIIGPTPKIGIGNAWAEPRTLIESLIRNKDAFNALDLYGMIHYWTDRFFDEDLWKHCTLKVFMVDRFTAGGIKNGSTEYIPCRYSGIPGLFTNGHISLDAALISLSPPNGKGNCSFGVSSDFTTAMARTAKKLIAGINHRMPWVYGDNQIHSNEIDYFVETDRQLLQVNSQTFTERDRAIGMNAGLLIDDEATIQIGLGRLSEAVLASLSGKRRLGVHSGLLSEGIVDLVENGVIDNSCKGLKAGKIVTTTIIGTDKVYRFVHYNQGVKAFPSSYTHSSVTLVKVNKLHAINSAIQVDLTGQINAETVGSAHLRGKTLKERTKALIAIAHPKFRDRLESERMKPFP